MATTLSDISAILKEIANEVFYSTDRLETRDGAGITLSKLIPIKPLPGVATDGDAVIPIIYKGASSTPFDPESDSFTEAETSQLKGTCPVRYRDTKIKISGKATDVSDIVKIEAGALIDSQTRAAVEQLLVDIEDDYSGDGTGGSSKAFEGVQSYIKTSGNVLGFDVTTYTALAATITDVSGALSKSALRTLIRTIIEPSGGRAGNRLPVGLTSGKQWQALATEMEGTYNFMVTSNDVGTYKAGATAIVFDGVPIYKVPGYDTDRLDIIDLSTFGRAFIRDVKVDKLAKTSDYDEYAITAGGWLWCTNPGANGALINLT